jgi:hypothetical protein
MAVTLRVYHAMKKPEMGRRSWQHLSVRLARFVPVWMVALALVFGGCGSDSEPEEVTSSTTVVRVTTTAPRETTPTTARLTTTTRRPPERSD